MLQRRMPSAWRWARQSLDDSPAEAAAAILGNHGQVIQVAAPAVVAAEHRGDQPRLRRARRGSSPDCDRGSSVDVRARPSRSSRHLPSCAQVDHVVEVRGLHRLDRWFHRSHSCSASDLVIKSAIACDCSPPCCCKAAITFWRRSARMVLIQLPLAFELARSRCGSRRPRRQAGRRRRRLQRPSKAGACDRS